MSLNRVRRARKRIKDHVLKTELVPSDYLSKLCKAKVFLKLENKQVTGSFKIRGACNRILTLSEAKKSRPLVTASSGNHANAFAYLLQKFGLCGIIYLPENASASKLDPLRSYPVELIQIGNDTLMAEREARKFSEENKLAYISPYNDVHIMAGQGTVAMEIIDDLETVTDILVPVGGGGLIAGMGMYLKEKCPQVKLIGCQPTNSKVMYESVKAGKILDLESKPTLADGTAGGIEPKSKTLPICQAVIDEFILVSEIEILDAIKLLIAYENILVEGAAALSVASLIKRRDRFKGKTVVLVLTGEKISIEVINMV